MPKKVLIITYYFPPSGGAGVQRWLKFSKYLPEFGWEPVILTVDPLYAAYPVTDPSLTKEIPKSLKVYSTPATDYFSIYHRDRSKIPSAGFANSLDNSFKGKLFRFIRGNFFIPDPRKGWNKYAFKKACELIDLMGIKHVITTSPPHSTQLIGLKLKKKYPEIKWISDLRDPWTDIYYYKQFYPTIISKWIDSKYETNVLDKADKIITVGESLRNLFSLKLKGNGTKIEVVTNGFDDEDFSLSSSAEPPVFTITYVGTLSDIYPIEGFIEALIDFKEKGNEFLLRFIGTVSEKQKNLIKSGHIGSNTEFITYVDHSLAINYLLRSSVLLLIIPDHQSNKSIITGKLFEYLAAGKPVICLGPSDGDAAAIIRSAKAGETFEYMDKSALEDFLMRTMQHTTKYSFDRSKYSRRSLTLQFSGILENI